jgi:hypothetical protein
MDWKDILKNPPTGGTAEAALPPSPYMMQYVSKYKPIDGRPGAYEVVFDLTDVSAAVTE